MTRSKPMAMLDTDDVKIVQHVPVKKLKLVVGAYRSIGAKVVSRSEQGRKNEYTVMARFDRQVQCP